MKQITRELEREKLKRLVEMADAHCHLDLITNNDLIKESIDSGVKTIITNGVNTRSNMKSLEITDNINVFAALGVDPENAISLTKEELDFNIKMIRSNRSKIVAIGEIGLDYKKGVGSKDTEKQKSVFKSFLELAKELDMPISVHSRNAIVDVIELVKEYKMDRAHFHFFEGDVVNAKEIEKNGYVISIPPVETGRRKRVIRSISIENIMVESDAPVVGATPQDVEKSIKIIAEAKDIGFERVAEQLTNNTKQFFRTGSKSVFMRY